MPYDDDGSRFNFGDLEELLASYLSQPENITFNRLVAAIETITKVAGEQPAIELNVIEVADALDKQRLGGLTIATVAGLLRAVQETAGRGDILSHLTVREMETILSRAQRRERF